MAEPGHICGRGNLKTEPSTKEREMFAMRQAGHTLQTIGNVHGLSRERVNQILHKYFQEELAEIKAPMIRKKVIRRTKRIELLFEDSSSIEEPSGVIASMHKYGLTSSLSAMLGGKSTKPIYSKAMDAYVIGARFI